MAKYSNSTYASQIVTKGAELDIPNRKSWSEFRPTVDCQQIGALILSFEYPECFRKSTNYLMLFFAPYSGDGFQFGWYCMTSAVDILSVELASKNSTSKFLLSKKSRKLSQGSFLCRISISAMEALLNFLNFSSSEVGIYRNFIYWRCCHHFSSVFKIFESVKKPLQANRILPA